MASPRVQFRAVPPLDSQLRARTAEPDSAAALSLVASETIGMYFTLLTAELRALRLTRDEAVLACDALRDVAVSAAWASAAPVLLADLLADFEPSAAEFAARIRSWPRTQALALIDAVQRFWVMSAEGGRDVDAALIGVGLLRHPRLK